MSNQQETKPIKSVLACEHTKRKCVMIELDQNYVAMIIQRWEILTGQEAIKTE